MESSEFLQKNENKNRKKKKKESNQYWIEIKNILRNTRNNLPGHMSDLFVIKP